MHVMRPNGASLEGLGAFVDTLPPDICMAEVGTYSGESAKLFLRKAAKLHCIDLWLPYEDYGNPIGCMQEAEAAFDALQRSYSERIIKHKMASLEAAELFGYCTLDAVYLDADHSYPAVRADIAKWWTRVKHGGVLAGHDYDRCHIGVKLAVDELLGKPDQCFGDSTWMKVVP